MTLMYSNLIEVSIRVHWRRRGVLIAIKKNIVCTQVQPPFNNIEHLSLRLNSGILLEAVYISLDPSFPIL